MKPIDTIRDLARKVMEIAHSDKQKYIRSLFARNNSLEKVERPPVLTWPMCWNELIPADVYVSGSDHFIEHSIERTFRSALYHHEIIGDDYVIEPWYEIKAIHEDTRDTMWGVPLSVQHSGQNGGAFAFNPQIKCEDDIGKLKVPGWEVDKAATGKFAGQVKDILGDIMPVRIRYGLLIDYGVGMYSVSIPYWGSYLRGLEQMMWDMVDRPKWLHRFFKFLSDAHMKHFLGLEADGHINRNDHGKFGHCSGLPQDDCDGKEIRLKDCWGTADSQEFTLVSPQMWEEFLL